VARLHSDPAFLAGLETEFEPGFMVKYHLAPPIMSRKADSRGRPGKIEFGPWMRKVFALLAWMKPVRGKWFDLFGKTTERRMERELIVWFQAVLETIPVPETDEELSMTKTILSSPMEMRGYGPVKDEAVKKHQKIAQGLLAELGVTPQCNHFTPCRICIFCIMGHHQHW
jgi:indolepyruvate ferredoxin oxidoreductase